MPAANAKSVELQQCSSLRLLHGPKVLRIVYGILGGLDHNTRQTFACEIHPWVVDGASRADFLHCVRVL